MAFNNSHTLYLCYFGLREPLVQTQVLPYLREIKKLNGLKVSLLTFEPDFNEKWTAEQISVEQQKLASENINWHCLPYHKRPSVPATVYDVLNGTRYIIKLSHKEKIDIIHARAHVPMLMAMLANKFIKCLMIFDIRGLMAEEYADAGIWKKNSKPFRFIKRIELKGIEKASQIVVLTNRMRDYLVEKNLKKSGDIEVIPCCVDFSQIKQVSTRELKSSRFELIYAGSATGLYLLREMGSFFLELRKQKSNAFFRILTASSPQMVKEIFNELKIDKNDYSVNHVSPKEVSDYLSRAHIGISFRKPTFSQIAASPTKIPEYLACGLPVISNYGIGDIDLLLKEENVGICIKRFDQSELARSVTEILSLLNENRIAERCVRVAHKHFDLATIGSSGYQNVYHRLMKSKISAQ